MKKQHLAATASLGALALAGIAISTSASTRQEAAPANQNIAPQAQRVAVDSSGFRASEFAGVSVREQPASAASNSENSKAWIGSKPGAPRPTASEFERPQGACGHPLRDGRLAQGKGRRSLWRHAAGRRPDARRDRSSRRQWQVGFCGVRGRSIESEDGRQACAQIIALN